MAFGRQRRAPEPPVEPMPWEGIEKFVVSDVEQPATFRRKAVTGPRAIRVRSVGGPVRCFAPAVFVVQPDPEIKAYEFYAARDSRQPICALAPVTGGKGGEQYRVADGAGQEIGAAHRTAAAKRTIQHTWWLRQPGHPDVVARYHWAKGSAKEVAARGKAAVARQAGSLAESVVDSLIFGGDDSGGQSSNHIRKPVTWRAGEDEVALTSDHTDRGVRTYMPKAGWLDLRLVFALAVLREG
ncbi:hypothetical protein ACIPW9_31785 [Streptomyces sp. NPDC090052]|uniref:hypothetical protein n=1 Tax=Streptomyces sp. NPDC090052 TaxID=3365931 RepID=UPI0038019BC8